MKGATAVWVLCAAVVLLPSCASQPRPAPAAVSARLDRIDAGLAAAARYFISKQSPDGAWRSELYSFFRDGPSLTPYVATTLFFLPQGGDGARAAYRKGVAYLVGLIGPEGAINAGPGGLIFPVLTAAEASRVIVLERKTPEHLAAQRAWLACLRARQLNESLGWSPADPEYGGWGFSAGLPRKPPGGGKRMMVESNLVATLFGIAALRSAKLPPDDPAYAQALAFVKKCQNFSDNPATADPKYDDGGFYFIPDDPVQNKGGIAGEDRFGRRRFSSYGSMTADGLRVLLSCGLPPTHPRVVAARRWLERNFQADHNAGAFAADREVLRDATYYYGCWSIAHVFMLFKVKEIETPRGRVNWAEEMADELLRRQRPDASWVNRYTDAREDDPLVAGFWAAAALAICRGTLAGEAEPPAPCAPPSK